MPDPTSQSSAIRWSAVLQGSSPQGLPARRVDGQARCGSRGLAGGCGPARALLEALLQLEDGRDMQQGQVADLWRWVVRVRGCKEIRGMLIKEYVCVSGKMVLVHTRQQCAPSILSCRQLKRAFEMLDGCLLRRGRLNSFGPV